MFVTQTRKRKIGVDVENFPTGIYLVKLTPEGSNWIGKF